MDKALEEQEAGGSSGEGALAAEGRSKLHRRAHGRMDGVFGLVTIESVSHSLLGNDST